MENSLPWEHHGNQLQLAAAVEENPSDYFISKLKTVCDSWNYWGSIQGDSSTFLGMNFKNCVSFKKKKTNKKADKHLCSSFV